MQIVLGYSNVHFVNLFRFADITLRALTRPFIYIFIDPFIYTGLPLLHSVPQLTINSHNLYQQIKNPF